MVPGGLALDELVEANTEHPRDELEECEPPPFAGLAKIRRKRLGAFRRLVPPPIVFVAERRRKAFFRLATRYIARERLARNHRRQDAAFWARALEALDLRIGPAGFG